MELDNLSTRDPEGSETFYGALFGWQAQPWRSASSRGTMWRLPGYAEVLETIDPGLRRRQAQQGAPAGFEDPIGWMLPMTSDQSALFSVNTLTPTT